VDALPAKGRVVADIDRRRFIRRSGLAAAAGGAAWVAPSILDLDVAYAVASAPCGAAPNTAFVIPGTSSVPANNNGWAFQATNLTTSGGGLGVAASWYSLTNGFVVERDPMTPVTSASVTYQKSLGHLVGGRTYTFTYQIEARTVNQYTQKLQITLVPAIGSPTVLATYATAATAGATTLPDMTLQTFSTTFVPPAGGGTYQVVYTFTFINVATGNGAGDDIGVTAPVVTCA
jgi:hypothetical protein